MKPILPLFLLASLAAADQPLERIKYNNPGLAVDLGVGLWAWPLPMDFDGDGDLDLVVNCSDKPYNGVYVFENTTGDTGKNPMPVFKPARRISKGIVNVQISYPGGVPTVLTPGKRYPDFLRSGLDSPVKIDLPENVHHNKVRGNHWRVVDYDGDGVQDLAIGTDDWSEYGWDDAYDEHGIWKNGNLRGHVYVARNTGTNEAPVYAKPERILIDGIPLETFGWPCPSFVDLDGDGDLDLVCGEFLDGFTYFRNTGTRTEPRYEKGRRLMTDKGAYLKMHVQMITPVGFDWDGDGDTDIVSGNTSGNIAFFENLSGPGVEKPKWAAPVLLESDGKPIHILAGANGSIQGPCEAKWGYTTLSINDWDGDGLPDLIVNSIWGKVIWYRNTSTRTAPKLDAAAPVEVEWEGAQPHLAYGWLRPEGKGLLTQWRTTPVAVDWNKDGLVDLVMMDHEGFLAFFERKEKDGRRILLPPRRAFICEDATPEERKQAHFFSVPGEPMLLRYKGRQSAGGSGRRKLSVTDWDGDGVPDLLLNGANAAFVRQTRAADGKWFFKDEGLVSPTNIEGHDVSPTTVDFNGDGIPDFLGGAEDGYFYYLRNPRSK